MALTEYSITYTKVNQSSTSTHNTTVQLPKSGFALSGNTNLNIGQITRILFKHRNNNGGLKGTWTTKGRMYFGDGTYITSNGIAHTYNGDNYWTANTFSSGLPAPDKFATWTRMDMLLSGSGGTLQWEATSSHPITITVYFYKYEDLIVDADPPTASGVTLTDNSGYSTTYGNPVQGRSNLTITGQYALDPRYPDLTSRHTLTLEDSAGNDIYSASQADSSVFEVGVINVSGTITLTYTVVDGTGGSATYTGTITVLAYSPPSVTGLVVQRYTTDVDDQGHTTYVASEDGDHVWFTFGASATVLNSNHPWTLTVVYGKQDDTDETTHTIDGQITDSTRSYTNSRTILDAQTPIDPSHPWWFTVTATDAFGLSSSMTGYVDEATAFFDVEENGVSVGMRSNGKASDKRFEVADDYTAHFYGGIEGVTNYSEGEVDTGGTWINGGKIYRAVFSGQLTAGGTRSIGILAHTPAAVVRIYGGFYYSMDGLWRGIPFISYADIGWGFSAVVAASSGSVSAYVGSKYSFTSPRYINYILIVEYAANP